jgi:hypothetical protein
VSKSDPGWSCTELNVLDVLTEGERLTRSIASTLRYLEELP